MRFRVITQGLAVALALTALLATMPTGVLASITPAVASGRPDASIRVLQSRYNFYWDEGWFTWTENTSTHGVGVYNSTGKNQVAAADTQSCCDERHTFKITIKNRGNAKDRFRVKGTGTGLQGWTTSYFKGTRNITSAVLAGTYLTPKLAPGEKVVIKARLVGNSVPDWTGSRRVKVTSVADTTKTDVVKFKLRAADWCYC